MAYQEAVEKVHSWRPFKSAQVQGARNCAARGMLPASRSAAQRAQRRRWDFANGLLGVDNQGSKKEAHVMKPRIIGMGVLIPKSLRGRTDMPRREG